MCMYVCICMCMYVSETSAYLEAGLHWWLQLSGMYVYIHIHTHTKPQSCREHSFLLIIQLKRLKITLTHTHTHTCKDAASTPFCSLESCNECTHTHTSIHTHTHTHLQRCCEHSFLLNRKLQRTHEIFQLSRHASERITQNLLCMYVCVYVCMCVCSSAGMPAKGSPKLAVYVYMLCVCMYVCVYVCMCVCM